MEAKMHLQQPFKDIHLKSSLIKRNLSNNSEGTFVLLIWS